MSDTDEHHPHSNERNIILLRIDALSKQVGSLEKKVDAFVEKVHANEIWRERIDNRLIAGNEHMTAQDRVYNLLEKKIEACTDKVGDQRDDVEKKYVSKDMVKWIIIGASAASSGTAYALLKILGAHS